MPQAAPPVALHPREVEIRALHAIAREVEKSGSGIPPLLLDLTEENRRLLAFIGRFVTQEINADLAMTDPARYRKLCRLKMELTLRGYHGYFTGAGCYLWKQTKV